MIKKIKKSNKPITEDFFRKELKKELKAVVDKMDQRMDKMDQRMSAMDQRMSAMDQGINERINGINERMVLTNERIDRMDRRIDKVSLDTLDIKERLKTFITKDEFNEKLDIVIGMLEKSAKKEKDHDIEHVANIAAHDRFESEITKIKTHVDIK